MAKRRANGEGSLYQRKDGTWTAQYTDTTGKRRYLYGKTQQEVRAKMKEAVQVMETTGVVLEPKKISVAAWVKEWMDTYKAARWRDSTYAGRYSLWKQHILPYFDGIPLKELRHETIQQFMNEKASARSDGKSGGYAGSMCQLVYSTLNEALDKAVDLGYIVKNPAKKVQVIKRDKKPKQIFTPEEQRVFEAAVREEMKEYYPASVLLVMMYTGLRIGEALGLQVGDIDFDNKEITISRTVARVENKSGVGGHVYVSDPKTENGRRIVPMSPTVEKLLADQIAYREQIVSGMRDVWKYEGVDLRYCDAGFIYMTTRGNVIGTANMRKKLVEIVNNAGIESKVSPHGLRHTFATRWLESGFDVRSLADVLGHGDAKVTLNIYAHSLPEHRRNSMVQLDELMSANDGDKPVKK